MIQSLKWKPCCVQICVWRSSDSRIIDSDHPLPVSPASVGLLDGVSDSSVRNANTGHVFQFNWTPEVLKSHCCQESLYKCLLPHPMTTNSFIDSFTCWFTDLFIYVSIHSPTFIRQLFDVMCYALCWKFITEWNTVPDLWCVIAS